MTDQEFLSQNLDILYQNTPFSTLAKDWIFFTNSSEFGDLAFVLFIILLPLSFCFLALSFLLEEQDENRSIKSRTKIPKNIYKLFQIIFGGIFALITTTFIISMGVQLAFDASFSSRYIKLNELNKLPILKDVTNWLIETIKDKPYEKQNVADEKLKLINDL